MKNEMLLFEHVSLLCLVIEFFTTEAANMCYIYDSGHFSSILLLSYFLPFLPTKRVSVNQENKITQTLESNLAFGTRFQT